MTLPVEPLGSSGSLDGMDGRESGGEKRGKVAGMRRRSSRRSLSGLDAKPTDDRGWTPLHVASKAGDICEVVRLLNDGADANELAHGPKTPGATPLHLAAGEGHVEIMDILLERGANIEARTKGPCRWTPLHHAAKDQQRAAMRFLLENGAFLSPDMSDPRFNPPLHYCPGLEYAYELKIKLYAQEASQQHLEECA
eukprot:TRINITY_DN30445_c0_g1_i1.p1 TRINITY_DN30445_c0_g1~~TRINITY_DN30445_c0_g1_i1.p1  ORF type:complete len:196 (-),score=32.96 TRINITY_DN30445_c0_g1_i1:41-628(-)